MDMMPPGFRFYPTEEELVSFYLHNKLEARREDLLRAMDRLIPVLDIYGFNPWELPRKNLIFIELIMNQCPFLLTLLVIFHLSLN